MSETQVKRGAFITCTVSTMPTITIHYTLRPPAGTPVPEPASLNPDTTLTFDVPPPQNPTDQGEYYAKLKGKVEEAKERLGVDLTAWRDAVGTREANKEPKKTKGKVDEEDEEGEGEGEGEDEDE